MPDLPRLMVAPNGARKTKADHPALPMTVDEICSDAKECFASGADGIHVHLRDQQGRHLLDAAAYRDVLARLNAVVPDMQVQITTEAAGRYDPAHQCAVALASGAQHVSVSPRELGRALSREDIAQFARNCTASGISVQWILYDAGDFALLPMPMRGSGQKLLFVLGRYDPATDGRPEMLAPFLQALHRREGRADWAACAFGPGETECLLHAAKLGGKLRVGFENSLLGPDGSPAASNAERVRQMLACLSLKESQESGVSRTAS